MISVDDYFEFIDEALAGMVEILEVLGDELANERPDLPGANSPYAVVTHCLGVMADWGGDAVAGRVVQRDRAAEFRAQGAVAELIARLRSARQQLAVDLRELDAAAAPRGRSRGPDAELAIGRSQGGAAIHILEELAQHRGQLEITRDVLIAGVNRPER